MSLYLNESKARLHFKKMLGGANHLIVTSLVGLEAVERGLIKEIPDDLHAAWGPIDPVISARRARRMILDMALAQAVNSLDVYISWSRRHPALMQNVSLRDQIDGAGLSVTAKFAALSLHYNPLSKIDDPSLPKTLVAMVSVMIAWRNRGMHEEHEITITDEHKAQLIKDREAIAARYRGLSVAQMMDGFEKNAPTFKEIASLIQATQDVVRELERLQFKTLDREIYLRDLILQSLNLTESTESKRIRELKKRVQSIWGKDPSEKSAVVCRFLKRLGLSEENKYDYSVEFGSDLIRKISEMRTLNVVDWLLQK